MDRPEFCNKKHCLLAWESGRESRGRVIRDNVRSCLRPQSWSRVSAECHDPKPVTSQSLLFQVQLTSPRQTSSHITLGQSRYSVRSQQRSSAREGINTCTKQPPATPTRLGTPAPKDGHAGPRGSPATFPSNAPTPKQKEQKQKRQKQRKTPTPQLRQSKEKATEKQKNRTKRQRPNANEKANNANPPPPS